MRRIILLGILILSVSGCLEEKLSPGEAQLCLLSTNMQPSLIPVCKTQQECEQKLGDIDSLHTFEHIPVGSDLARARKGIVGVWSSIRAASTNIEQIHRGCASLSVADILPGAVSSASELQNALKSSEEAQEFTYQAMRVAVMRGGELGLENVKDTKAFEEYAELVQMVHSLEVQNPASEWSHIQQSNREYFENIGRQLSKNKSGAYGVEWQTVFGTYRTGVEIGFPERARVLMAVSPLWQGALSAFLGKSKSNNAHALVSTIRANEIVAQLEQVASPPNGIVFYAWKKMREMDRAIGELKSNEKNSEINGMQKLIELKEKAKWIMNEQNEWKKIGMSAQEDQARNDFGVEKLDFSEKVEEWGREFDSLREARIFNSISIGQRTAEWRKWTKKGEDIRESMRSVEKLFEKWSSECSEKKIEGEAGENPAAGGAHDCVKIMEAYALAQNEATQRVENMNESRLRACVQKLNQVEGVLNIPASNAEWFEEFFGNAKNDACEAAQMNRITEYENQFLVQEWKALKQSVKKYERALGNATYLLDWPEEKNGVEIRKRIYDFFSNEEEFMHEEEIQNKIEEIEILKEEAEAEIKNVVNAAFMQATWDIIQPEKVVVGKKENAKIVGHVRAPWREELAVENWVIIPNPGFDTIEDVSEGWNAVLDGDIIIFETEKIGKDDISIRGSGSRVWVHETERKWKINTFGNDARVEEIRKLKTVFYPQHATAEWSPPHAVAYSTPLLRTNGTTINLHNGQGSFVLEKEQGEISISYDVSNLIRVHTNVEGQHAEWGRSYTHYRITAENGLDSEVEANIFSGVSGANSESVFISNENGEKVSEIRDASEGIVLIKQIIPSKGVRSYWIRVERAEGLEEWSSVVEFLKLELNALEKSSFQEISSVAGKLKMKIYALNNEKNEIVLAQKVSELQSEVSGLLTKKEFLEGEYAQLESEWMSAVQHADENSSWLRAGELARQKLDFSKWRDAIVKLGEEKKKDMKKVEEFPFENRKWLEENVQLLEKTSKIMSAYEKAISVGCSKLAEVGFICPIMEDALKSSKKVLSTHGKTLSTVEKKIAKWSADKQAEELKNGESTWREMNEELDQMYHEMETALRAVRNAGVERVAELKRKVSGNQSEEIVLAVEKANTAIEKEEFGKGLFVAQSILFFLNGNNATGLVSLPPVAWPIAGVIIVVSIWIGWKEWKKKNKVVIQKQTIPRASTEPQVDSKNSAFEHPTTQGELRPERKAGGERYTRVQAQGLARKKGEN